MQTTTKPRAGDRVVVDGTLITWFQTELESGKLWVTYYETGADGFEVSPERVTRYVEG